MNHVGALTKPQQTLLARHAGRVCPRCERFRLNTNNCPICVLCLGCCDAVQSEVGEQNPSVTVTPARMPANAAYVGGGGAEK